MSAEKKRQRISKGSMVGLARLRRVRGVTLAHSDAQGLVLVQWHSTHPDCRQLMPTDELEIIVTGGLKPKPKPEEGSNG